MINTTIPSTGSKSERWTYRIDLLHAAGILLVFAAVIALVSPARAFPITDDWVYAQGVQDLLAGDFKKLDWAQPIALPLMLWGALFSLLFGFGFTTLAVANLVVSAACLLVFYFLLRQLGVRPRPALFGAAILGFNPLYVHFSYIFMTDIMFLAFMLLACLCFVRAFQEESLGWLAAASVITALAFLTRQFGLLLVGASLLYLLLMWWRRLLPRQKAATMMGIVVGPSLLAYAVYSIWERTQEPTLAGVLASTFLVGALQDPAGYLVDRAIRIAVALAVSGLFLLPLVRVSRYRVFVAVLFALIAPFLLVSARTYGTVVPQNGNTINYTGFNIFEYEATPLWPQQVLVVVTVLGALLVSAYLAEMIGPAWGWLAARRWRNAGNSPLLFVYLVLGLFALVTFLVTPIFFDRYLLPIFPLALLPPLLRMSTPNTGEQAASNRSWRWLLLVPVALFGVLAQRDYMEHSTVRWQAAEDLVAKGVQRRQISAGYEWGGWFFYREGAELIRQGAPFEFPGYVLLDPVYKISDGPVEGYEEVGSLPYRSWLNGGEVRHVLQLRRE
jgi:4-amino-4-deoxy-L-arabinose transferase-like glycosyltransferase